MKACSEEKGRPQLMERKRRHHYVWRKYLEGCATDGKICCCMNGTIFRPSLTNVGLRKDFYKVTELRSEEVEFIRRFFIFISETTTSGSGKGSGSTVKGVL